jgi:microbial collagenase
VAKKYSLTPPLYNIMMMDYGYEDLYQWGYFAMHYLVNNHPSEVTLLAQALRSTDTAAYEATIKAVIGRTEAGFEAYVVANSDAVAANAEPTPVANTIGTCDLQQQYVRKVDAAKVSGVITNQTNTPVSLMWIKNTTGEYVGSKIYKTLNQGDSYTFDNWSQNNRVALSDYNYNCLGVAVLRVGAEIN